MLADWIILKYIVCKDLNESDEMLLEAKKGGYVVTKNLAMLLSAIT